MKEHIRALKKCLLTLYPVRRTERQKRDFRIWAIKQLQQSGWEAYEEIYGSSDDLTTGRPLKRIGKFNNTVNIVSGDPDQAVIFLCAHYDTPSNMIIPNFVSPTNTIAYVGYHVLAVILLVIFSLIGAFAISSFLGAPDLWFPLSLGLLIALLWAVNAAPPNQNNANCNSSGVATVLAIAERLDWDKRVCILLLDNNDKDLLGASSFQKKYRDAAKNCLFMNFDCVGDGANILLIPSKRSCWDGALLADLSRAFPESDGMKAQVLESGLRYFRSDHRLFPFHVAVCACRRLKGLGYYIPNLWTDRDTVMQEENIQYLTEGTAAFIGFYLEGGEESGGTDTPKQE